MVSVNIVTAFVVFKILHNTISFPCKNLCLQITADVTKITENNLSDLAFSFTELSDRNFV